MKKCLISLMVVLFTGLGCFAFSGSGGGTEVDPYVITDVFQLQEMNADPNASYILANDIDAVSTAGWNSGAGFEPIGNVDYNFKGTFDGKDFTIKNLYINLPSSTHVGLFGIISYGAVVENVGLIDANVCGNYAVGTLVGTSINRSLVYNCYATGNVTISPSGSSDTKSGGLVGSQGASTISTCYSEVNVTALSSRYQLGGLCGYSRARSGDPVALIENCYSTGTVTSNGWKVGGLLGDADGPNSKVSKCYSTAKVIGSYKRGLVGYNYLRPIIGDSYWDIQTSGCSSSYGGVGRTTVQMMQQGTFAGWDFKNVWGIDEGSSYPYLLAFHVEPNLVGLEISGPDEVVENSEQQYKAIASYDDGSEKDITGECEWFADECGFAGIEPNGLFYSDIALYMNKSCNIYAEYTTDANEVLTAEKEIAILPMCPTGSALTFDGVDDYVDCGNSAVLNGFQQMTLSAWVYVNEFSTGTYQGRIISKRSWPNNSYDLVTGIRNGTPIAGAGFYGQNGIVGVTSTDYPFETNKWYHLAATNTGTVQKMYINGIEIAVTNVNTGPIVATNVPLWIGQFSNNHEDAAFNGQIDDVAIFNRALTPEEVQYNMYHKLAGNENGLVGYWDFDEGQGQIANDKSGNGNDGQLGGSEEVQISDPNWVSPGAPVICTKPALAKRNISLAMETKKDIIEDLDYALKAELAANTMLLEVQRDKQFKNVWPSANIVRARMQTFLAIVQERIARSKIVVSINHLANAIEYLNAPAEETTVKPGNPKK